MTSSSRKRRYPGNMLGACIRRCKSSREEGKSPESRPTCHPARVGPDLLPTRNCGGQRISTGKYFAVRGSSGVLVLCSLGAFLAPLARPLISARCVHARRHNISTAVTDTAGITDGFATTVWLWWTLERHKQRSRLLSRYSCRFPLLRARRQRRSPGADGRREG